MNKLLIIVLVFFIFGCSGSTGDINSESDIVKGCSYIACAIVTHGVLGLLNINCR